MARRRKSNRRRRGSFGFLYKLLSVLVICGAIVAALTLFFRVDTVVITGQQRYTEEEIREASGIAEGANLVLFNKYTAAITLSVPCPYIEEISINRKLPDTLLIQVRECSIPLAVVQDGSAWLVSASGKIVDQQEAAAAAEYAQIDGCELLGAVCGNAAGSGNGVYHPAEQLAVSAGGAGESSGAGACRRHSSGRSHHADHGL